MNCRNCGTSNEPGSKYCKECGKKLEQAAQGTTLAVDNHLRVGELIYAAYKESEAGCIDEAILACQGAIALNQESAPAHSLLGALYERKGDIAGAIREYEKVLALNPGSLADERKLEALKAGIVSVSPTPSTPRRTSLEKIKPIAPYVAAAASFVLILLLAIPFMRGEQSRTDTSARNGSREQRQVARPPGGQSVPSPGLSPERRGAQPAPGQYYGPSYANRAGVADQQPAVEPSPSDSGKPGSDGAGSAKRGIAAVPLPGSEARARQSRSDKQLEAGDRVKEPPVIVPVIGTKDAGEAPPVAPPDTGAAPSRPVKQPSGPARSEPAPEVPPPTEPAVNPGDRAVRLQRMGQYREAIDAYREALNQTSDPGRIYQQMARCYQRLEQHDLAIDSYSRAIRSYRDQLAAGRDEADVRRSIRSCEAGIEVSRNQKRSEEQ